MSSCTGACRACLIAAPDSCLTTQTSLYSMRMAFMGRCLQDMRLAWEEPFGELLLLTSSSCA